MLNLTDAERARVIADIRKTILAKVRGWCVKMEKHGGKESE